MVMTWFGLECFFAWSQTDDDVLFIEVHKRREKVHLSNINSCLQLMNDYTLDKLDAGKSVQGNIECVTVHHQIFLSTCVHLRCKLHS